MYWLKVAFVVIVISRVESIQSESNETGDRTTRPCATTANACVNGTELILNFEFLKETSISYISTYWNCYEFSRTNDSSSFIGEKNTNVSNTCRYFLNQQSDIPLYYIEGSDLSKVHNACPQQDKICLLEVTCPLNNFNVNAVFDKSSSYRNLNISWDKINSDEVVDVSIVEETNSDYVTACFSESYVRNHPLKNNTILRPGFVSEDEVYPGCRYKVVVDYSGANQRPIYCSLKYTVPECENCITSDDCYNFEQKPEILNVSHIAGDRFLVSWNPGKTFRQGKLYVNSEVYFEYGVEAAGVSLEAAQVTRNNVLEYTAEIVMKLSAGKKYALVGTFSNNGSCAVQSPQYHFTAPTESASAVLIVIPVAFVLLAILLALNYKKIPKLKTKMLNLLVRTGWCDSPHEPVRMRSNPIHMDTNTHYIPTGTSEEPVDEYEFPRSRIIIKEVIGSGAFGQVYSAKAIGIGGIRGYRMVAVKTLGEGESISREATNDFIAEIEICKKVGYHMNVVTLLGCCTVDTPFMMIMELVPCGDLKKYLLELRAQWLKMKNVALSRQFIFPDTSDGTIQPPSPLTPVSIGSSRLPSTSETVFTMLEDPMTPLLSHYTLDKVLDHTELQNFALQIAKGMSHLEKIGVTHRDLAARNILISEHKILKISDFGLSRCGPYVNHKTKRLPLRWMAIEAIVEQKYDSKSDVWSFGVVLWEIGTLGAFPYDKIPDSFIQQSLQLGRRLERPEICTNELYSVMQQCWSVDPEQRPTFRELVEALDVKKRKIYANFNQLNPTYFFPPSDMEKVDNPVRLVDVNMDA
ncbi:fibroblast growth factor receptor 3-like isoform X1 [Zophobas morio]|uniref:fibroblast growth factor receptor 3-like isoform X1 n=1 Tax=Zophobas morio TaxID=2755281 RepID=UPI0030838D80